MVRGRWEGEVEEVERERKAVLARERKVEREMEMRGMIYCGGNVVRWGGRCGGKVVYILHGLFLLLRYSRVDDMMIGDGVT